LDVVGKKSGFPQDVLVRQVIRHRFLDPHQLQRERVCPIAARLCGYKLDFRFR